MDVNFESGDRPPTLYELVQDHLGTGQILSIEHSMVRDRFGGWMSEEVLVQGAGVPDNLCAMEDEWFIGMQGPAKLRMNTVTRGYELMGTSDCTDLNAVFNVYYEGG